MRTLVEAADNVALVPDPAGWGRDCDTWDDFAAARQRVDDLAAARQRVDDLAAARQQLDEGR
jgi:hypothetical protein